MPETAMREIDSYRENSFRHLKANGIKKSALDDFESFLTTPDTLIRPSLIVRCHINEGNCNVRVVVDKQISRPRLQNSFLPFLQRSLSPSCGPSEFFALISDNLYISEHRRRECMEYFKNVPFLRCDHSNDDDLSLYTILMPDLFMQDSKYRDEFRAIEEAVSTQEFERRIEIIKWRGSLHSSQYANDSNYLQFPRYLLLLQSLKHPDIVDARLTNYSVENSDLGAALKKRLETTFGEPAEFIPAEGFVRYKYLISIDGVGASWKRTATILASGAVLLLQHRWTEFFYPGLKPWVHYVPVKDDISDLVQRYEWLREHPVEARSIAENGLRFAKAILYPIALQRYFAQVLTECSRLYKV